MPEIHHTADFSRLTKGRKSDRGADELTKLYFYIIVNVQVPLPADKSGRMSFTAQQEIVATYATIEQYKRYWRNLTRSVSGR